MSSRARCSWRALGAGSGGGPGCLGGRVIFTLWGAIAVPSARIDHAAGAAQVGMVLRPTELVLFGQARGGTPLMQDRQTTGIDLPLKALAWEDAEGHVWLTHNEASWLAQRHQLGAGTSAAVAALDAAQVAITLAATAPAPPEAVEQ